MAKQKKKGISGQAKNFITRTQAVRKLQISLPDFRKLCIFKGIYPREPRNKKKVSKSATHSTTFYYTKDIQYLLHEPLLQRFREHDALSKKIARALGRNEIGDAARLEKGGKGKIKLDHIIKERYPTFIDALRDLDDALSMLFLFASLPSTSAVPPKTIKLCQRLCLEFEQYIIASHSLRKSFLSIKGIYYQATIQGQDVMWLVPYKFVQRITNDVDFKIMGTFVEFYTTLLGFVNFRLYTSIGLIYPPKFDIKSDELGGELNAFTLEGQGLHETKAIESNMPESAEEETILADDDLQKKIDEITMEANGAREEIEDANVEDFDEGKIDTFETTGNGADILLQPEISNSEASSLFSSLTVFLSRETPRHPLEFILRAFGCKRIGWDTVLGDGSFTTSEIDASITHQIVDRPPVTAASAPVEALDIDEAGAPKSGVVPPGYRVPGRVYIQPQWIWDCINECRLIRPDEYAPGQTLPPHLSPWMKPKQGEYNPRLSLVEQEREGEAEEFAEEEEEAAAIEAAESSDPKKQNSDADAGIQLNNELNGNLTESVEENGMEVAGTDDSDQEQSSDEEFGGFDEEPVLESSDEEETARNQYQAELEAEAAGLSYTKESSSASQITSVNKAERPLKSILKAEANNEARKRAEKKRREEEEDLQRKVGVMSRKKRKLFEKMQHGNRKRDQEAETLRKKRRKIEKRKELEQAAMAL